MIICSNDPVDLTGWTKRDLRDIENSLKIERQKLDDQDLDEDTKECLIKAMHCAFIISKQRNKEKYTPKKYRK